MQQVQKIIEYLGYSPKEAKVYLTALGLGEAHVSDIAKKVKMPRTSTQVIINKLHKDGLMNFYVVHRYKYWVAESPDILLKNLQKKEEMMKEALPRIQALKPKKQRKYIDPSESLGFLRMMADSSLQPIMITDEDELIQYVNSAWEEQFGYYLEEIKGKTPRIFKSGKTNPEVYKKMWQALIKESMFQTDEMIDRKKDGSLFNLMTTIFPVAHNGLLFYVQILDDITKKKRVEAVKQKFIQA
jgi:PAS domain S-box-containing protein